MSRGREIDPRSPVPLYHQIAEAIRARIEAGELAPGEALEPLRRAAETWNVNLHTVRHAYAALARSGLVESNRGPRGTRVAAGSVRPSDGQAGLRSFLDRVAGEAAERYGLTPAELAAALRQLRAEASEKPRVWVVECSAWQCESHARELRASYDVDARPWPLDRGAEPPAGTVLSTYFHYNDVRCLWPRLLSAVRFVTIHPDPALIEGLAGARRVIVGERDLSTVEAVTADLLALFDERELRIEPFVDDDPASCLAREGDAPVLFTPRVWAELSDAVREHPRALELRYVFDRGDLEELAGKLSWTPKQVSAAAVENRR